MSYYISICIPTYNGGKSLKYNINKLIEIQNRYKFEICVSDNASNDDTQKFMLEKVYKYSFIKYHRNKENMGIAYNFDYVLKMASGKYRWLLGDDDEIIENKLKLIIDKLMQYNPDICIVNSPEYDSRNKFIKNIDSQLFQDNNEILAKIGFYMSWMSCYIFLDSAIKNINIKSITDNAFPHLIGTLKFLENKCRLYYLNEICVKNQMTLKECRYSNKIIEYFINDWYEVTRKINNYNNEAKNKFIDNTIINKVTFYQMLAFKKNNIINSTVINTIKPYLKYYPNIIKLKIYGAYCFPKTLLIYMWHLKKKLIK